MLGTKTHEFFTWTIITEIFRLFFLILEHFFKKCSTLSTSLHWFMHVKIKYTKRFNLFDSWRLGHEQFFSTNLNKSNNLIIFDLQIHPTIRIEKLVTCCDSRRQFLCLSRCLPNLIYDLIKLLLLRDCIICFPIFISEEGTRLKCVWTRYYLALLLSLKALYGDESFGI